MEAARERPARPPPSAVQVQRTHQNEALTKVTQLSEEAHLYVTQGLTCDEQGQGEQAKVLYEKALRCIMEALSYPADPSNPQASIIKTKQAKMKSTQRQMQERLHELIRSDPNVARSIDDPPPSYEDATTPTSQTDFELALSLQDSIMAEDTSDSSRRSSLVANASEVFRIADGVQIFFITPEGYVSAPSYPSELNILKFTDQTPAQGASNVESPPAFLRVGDWTYPLNPGCSPALQANWGAYIFPDTSAPEPGSAVGVIIPDRVTDGERAKFERILKELTAFQVQAPSPTSDLASAYRLPQAPPRPVPPTVTARPLAPTREYVAAQEPTPKPRGPRTAAEEEEQEGEEEEANRTSAKVAKGLVTAAEWISWGLEKGAEQTGKLLKKGSDKLQEQIQPEERLRKIDPRAQKGVEYARVGTAGAVKVSRYVVEKLGQATMYLAREAAPHVRKHGEKLLPASMVKKDGGRSKLDNVAEVAVGGLQGFGTVYIGLEKAAKALGKNLADETVNVVQHKYGEDAGKFTENTVYAAGNIGVTIYNANHLGVKAIAKRAAKDTGLAVVEDVSGKEVAPSNGRAAKQQRTEKAAMQQAAGDGEKEEEEDEERMEVDTEQGAVSFSKNEKALLPP